MPLMKAAFDVLEGLDGLATVEDQDNVSFPIPEQLMTSPWCFDAHLF